MTQIKKRSVLELLCKMNPNGSDPTVVSRSSNRESVLTASDVAASLAGLNELQTQYVNLFMGDQLDYASFEINFLMKALIDEDKLKLLPFVTMQKALKAAVVVDLGGGWCHHCSGTGWEVAGKLCPSCGGAGYAFKHVEVAKKAGIKPRDWSESKQLKTAFELIKSLLLTTSIEVEAHISKRIGR